MIVRPLTEGVGSAAFTCSIIQAGPAWGTYFLTREKVPKSARGLVSEQAATRPRTPAPHLGLRFKGGQPTNFLAGATNFALGSFGVTGPRSLEICSRSQLESRLFCTGRGVHFSWLYLGEPKVCTTMLLCVSTVSTSSVPAGQLPLIRGEAYFTPHE